MPSGFDAAFVNVKQLVADFWADEKFYLSPVYLEIHFAHRMPDALKVPPISQHSKDKVINSDLDHAFKEEL